MQLNTKNTILIIISGLFSSVIIFAVLYFILIYTEWDPDKKMIQNIMSSSGIWTLITLVSSSPIAFAVWNIRDRYAIEKIENEKKSNNLKEFHKLADIITKTDYENKENDQDFFIQVSAVYNLLPYYSGSKGDDFIRPAGEILKNMWNIINKDNIRQLNELSHDDSEYLSKLRNISKMFRETSRNPLANAIIQVIFNDGGKYIKNGLKDFNYFNFTGMNLKELTDEDTIFNITSFFRSNLQDTEFNFNLSYANLELANLDGVICIDKKIHRSVLKSAELNYGTFFKTEFNYSNMKKVNMTNSFFELTCFKGCKLKKAKINDSTFSQVDFSDANFKKTYFLNSTLKNVSFDNANLERTYFINCDISGANFHNAKLSGVNFLKSLLPSDFFSQVESLFGCLFLKSDLKKLNLKESDISLLQEQLGFVILWDVNLIPKNRYKMDDTYTLECKYGRFITVQHKLINISFNISQSNKINQKFGWKLKKIMKHKRTWQVRI